MEFVKGDGVEWNADSDNTLRFGVVMCNPYLDTTPGFEPVFMVKCTTDTFRGDPRCQVPVLVSKLRPRKP